MGGAIIGLLGSVLVLGGIGKGSWKAGWLGLKDV